MTDFRRVRVRPTARVAGREVVDAVRPADGRVRVGVARTVGIARRILYLTGNVILKIFYHGQTFNFLYYVKCRLMLFFT